MTRKLRPLAALAVLVAIVAVAGPSPAAPRPWTRTAGLGTPRAGHTLTVLEGPRCGPSCGKVLAVGGVGTGDGEVHASAELYDPVGRTWKPTGSLSGPRRSHSATLLADGRVLVVGGHLPNVAPPTPTAELYDPVTGSWSPTGAMSIGREGQSATLLAGPGCGANCGKVLVAGGTTDQPDPVLDFQDDTAVAELYDPQSGTWARTGPMSLPRTGGVLATLLTEPGCSPRCGKVLVAGPIGGSKAPVENRKEAELYDPVAGVWLPAGSRVATGRPGAMVQLASGKVLVVDAQSGDGVAPRSADMFDPLTGAWQPAKVPPMDEIELLLRLPGGRVLGVAGSAAVIYKPESDRWEATDGLNEFRLGLRKITVLLGCRASGGRVLVGGGAPVTSGGTVGITGSELYDRVPTVQAIAPATGALAGGTTVKVTGTGLVADNAVGVRFGDRDATVVDVDPAGTGITAVSPAGAALGPVPVTVTVDGVPAEVCAPQFTYGPNPSGPNLRELSVEGTSVAEGDRGTTPATFRLTLNQPLDRPLTVRYATKDATATAGEDYTVSRGDASIPAGQTSVDVAVGVVGDTADEPDETFALAVAADDAGVRVAVPQAVATILDDDGPTRPPVAPPPGAPDPVTSSPGAPQPGDPSALPANLPQPGPGSPANPLANPGSATQPGGGLATQPGPGLATQPSGAVQSAPVVQAAPAAQVQAQSVVQAQPGLMVERQRQAQAERAEDTYLASARRPNSRPSPALPAAAGVMAALVALAWPRTAAARTGSTKNLPRLVRDPRGRR